MNASKQSQYRDVTKHKKVTWLEENDSLIDEALAGVVSAEVEIEMVNDLLAEAEQVDRETNNEP